MTSNETVLVSQENGVTRLTLNRPDKLNAFNEEQHQALYDGIEQAAGDESVRAILLTGAGRAFCAGQDLGDGDFDDKPVGDTLERLYNPLVRLIRATEKLIICAVNGVAAGAGANLALTCDIVLAARSAKFIQAFCKIGLVPDTGGTWTVTKLVGEARAKALMLTGQAISADQAADWGLIWRAVDDVALMTEAEALAESLAVGPTIGLGLTKQAIQAAAINSLDAQLDLERDLQNIAGATPDFAEGVSAFLEKRPAKFTGRR